MSFPGTVALVRHDPARGFPVFRAGACAAGYPLPLRDRAAGQFRLHGHTDGDCNQGQFLFNSTTYCSGGLLTEIATIVFI